jgi:hypothetical protein
LIEIGDNFGFNDSLWKNDKEIWKIKRYI